jgi:hypothetical protein
VKQIQSRNFYHETHFCMKKYFSSEQNDFSCYSKNKCLNHTWYNRVQWTCAHWILRRRGQWECSCGHTKVIWVRCGGAFL